MASSEHLGTNSIITRTNNMGIPRPILMISMTTFPSNQVSNSDIRSRLISSVAVLRLYRFMYNHNQGVLIETNLQSAPIPSPPSLERNDPEFPALEICQMPVQP
jgi:hypothetical protein